MNKTNSGSLSPDSLAALDIEALDAVTGGYYDPPDPTPTPTPAQAPAPSGTQGCVVHEPSPKTLEQRVGDFLKRIPPWLGPFRR